MLFQLCKQSLFFWLIGIEIETETRLARGGNKVIKEIIDLKTPTTSANACSGCSPPSTPPDTRHTPPPTHLQSLWTPHGSSEPLAAKSSNALVPYTDQIILIIF